MSPSTFHPEQISLALKAGKHIFSEKPLAANYEDCVKTEKEVEQHPDADAESFLDSGFVPMSGGIMMDMASQGAPINIGYLQLIIHRL